MTADHQATLNLRLTHALRAWMTSGDSFTAPPDVMSLAVWHGDEIAWPICNGESYSIIRVADGSIIEEDELSGCEALALDWESYDLTHHVVGVS